MRKPLDVQSRPPTCATGLPPLHTVMHHMRGSAPSGGQSVQVHMMRSAVPWHPGMTAFALIPTTTSSVFAAAFTGVPGGSTGWVGICCSSSASLGTTSTVKHSAVLGRPRLLAPSPWWVAGPSPKSGVQDIQPGEARRNTYYVSGSYLLLPASSRLRRGC